MKKKIAFITFVILVSAERAVNSASTTTKIKPASASANERSHTLLRFINNCFRIRQRIFAVLSLQ
uniref:Secreted protein n=1 Tax=Ascaris lumbricoides TaxID=6252 RepID=A0A0M3IWJ2_ASCLU